MQKHKRQTNKTENKTLEMLENSVVVVVPVIALSILSLEP